MNLLFTRFPLESTHGGAEVQTLSLMQGLKQLGHTVSFLGSCPTLLKECPKIGVPATELKIGPPPVTKCGAVSFLWRQLPMKKKLANALEEFPETDAILMLSLSEKILLTPQAIEKGMRVFWIEHDRIGRWLTGNPWLSRLRKLGTKVKTIGVSELSRELYIDLGWEPEDVIAIPDGVDPHRFSPAPTPRLNPRLLRIGCIARLTRDKGIDLLIEAMKGIPAASLRILGKGKEEEALRSFVINSELGNRVTIEEEVEDLGTFYHSLDLLVLPSREHDPFGLVAAEAMMLGIPVVVTNACGIADELESGTDAIVVEADSSAALAEAIFEMQDPEKRTKMAMVGKKTAQENFTVERMVDRYEEVLTKPHQL